MARLENDFFLKVQYLPFPNFAKSSLTNPCQRNSKVRCLLPSGPRNLVNSDGKKTYFLFAFVPLSAAANLEEEKGEGVRSQITREREAPRLKNSSGAASDSEGREAREDAGPHWVSDTLEPLVRALRVTVSRGFGAEDEHEAP